MKFLYKFLGVVLVFVLLSGCAPTGNNVPEPEVPVLTLDMINEWLNTSADIGPGTIANPVAILPIMHIDGPQKESNFYAFLNFKNKGRDHVRYQLTYLSCTCRAANLNFWQTMYIELSLPTSRNTDDIEVKFISFNRDRTGEYNVGFWGDSLVIPYGVTVTTFNDEFIPFFFGRTAAYMSNLSTMWDIPAEDYSVGEGRENFTIDILSGSSVSANNIIRAINAVITYHKTDEFFN